MNATIENDVVSPVIETELIREAKQLKELQNQAIMEAQKKTKELGDKLLSRIKIEQENIKNSNTRIYSYQKLIERLGFSSTVTEATEVKETRKGRRKAIGPREASVVIVNHLKQKGKGGTATASELSQVAENAGYSNSNYNMLLGKMVAANQLRKVERGIYTLA